MGLWMPFQTCRTTLLITLRAGAGATVATDRLAVFAPVTATLARCLIAVAARIRLIIQRFATTAAGASSPGGQFDVGAAAVVRPQHTQNHQKEVSETPGPESQLHRLSRIPFAQVVIHHMGMLETRGAEAPLGGQCNDLIRSIVKIGAALTPVPYDRKLPQFNVVQSDRLRHHHHGVLFHIDLELIELPIQRH